MILRVLSRIEIRVEDILDTYENPSIIEFIKEIDSALGEWDFTEKMYNYFKEQMNMMAAEKAKVY